jgi:hypothetical protein
MEQIDNCIVCGSTQITKFNGEMFPFVVDRMSGNPGSDTQCFSIHCPICDYHGTNLRFNTEEESRYYKEYMSGEYLTHRVAYDGPSVQSTSEYQHAESFVANRKLEIYNFVKDHANENNVESLLDYGGNNGDGIPDQFVNTRCYVLDTEIREHNSRVTFITPNSPCEQMDLIMCSHVLEHVSDINYHMKKMRAILKPQKFLYVEVPNERGAQSMDGRKFHEHINIFSMANLEFLFDLHNFDVVKKETFSNSYDAVFGILGRAR